MLGYILYYTLGPKPGRPCRAKPSAAKGIACPGSILTTVKRKKEVKKGEVDDGMVWSGLGMGRKRRGSSPNQVNDCECRTNRRTKAESQ